VSRPRGLCWNCYYTPGIRDRYLSTSRHASRGQGNIRGNAKPAESPTRARPGSQAKIAVLEQRARDGQELWHPDDERRLVNKITRKRYPVSENPHVDLHQFGGVAYVKSTNNPQVQERAWSFGRIEKPEAVTAFQARLVFPISSMTPTAGIALGDLPPRVFLWEAYRKLFGKNPKGKNQRQVGSCFTADTRIRMADGSQKRIDQIRLNDEVLTAEGNTGRVRHLFVRHESECLVRIKLRGHYGIAATAEHPVLTKRGYVRMDRLRLDDYVAIPRYIPGRSTAIQTADHRHWTAKVTSDRRTKRFAGVVGRRATVVQVAPVPDLITMTRGFGRIVGLFLAEGHTDRNKLTWTFHRNERDTLASELVQLLRDELGAEANIQERGRPNTIKVNLHGRVWSELFASLCGNGSGFKRMHPDITSGPGEFLEGVWSGWIDGDGHTGENTIQGTTVSRDLALSMFDIANALGLHPRITHCDPKVSHGVKKRLRRYDVVIPTGEGTNRQPMDDSAQWRKVMSVIAEPYQGDVYNFEVDGDNSYVAEGIGVHNCVSFGTNTAVERTMASEIIAGEPEEFRFLAEEVTYGGSRVEVGGGQINGDGSVGAWAADWFRRWGGVARGVYGSYDLREYSEVVCRQFGKQGVPALLETEAKVHPVSDTTLVTSWQDAMRFLAAGYGIAVCSDQGFTMQRDARGICYPSGTWQHCVCADGYVADVDDGYIHIENSWDENAHTGPVGWGDPSSAGFWAPRKTFERMLRQRDTWAFAGVSGWRSEVLPLWLA
jgi:hypothetical protein